RGADGGELRLRADLFVDATGLRGAVRERVPALDACCPRVPRAHTIEAVHQTCLVADLAGPRPSSPTCACGPATG
ncbi:MAG: hypothetical protein QGH45_23910, partial [Myxococcota bacterium]|nr:hypothetical protein [Myxococcota bacterium]